MQRKIKIKFCHMGNGVHDDTTKVLGFFTLLLVVWEASNISCILRRQFEAEQMGDSKKEVRRFLDERGQVFQKVMPLAKRNLAIAQHPDQNKFHKVEGGRWEDGQAKNFGGEFRVGKTAN